MALLQISEPGQSPQPHQRKNAVGIDLGTTNSLVAAVRSGMSETLADEQGRHLLPSVVHYTKEGVSCIGYEAAEHSTTDPLNTLSSIKRLMGRGINDIKTLGSQLPYTFAEDDGGMPKIITAAGAVSLEIHRGAEVADRPAGEQPSMTKPSRRHPLDRNLLPGQRERPLARLGEEPDRAAVSRHLADQVFRQAGRLVEALGVGKRLPDAFGRVGELPDERAGVRLEHRSNPRRGAPPPIPRPAARRRRRRNPPPRGRGC